jgi:hypothetical protein
VEREIFWTITSPRYRNYLKSDFTIMTVIILLLYYGSLSSSVSKVSDYGLDDLAIGFLSPAHTKRIFPLGSVSRPALGPT